MNDFCRFRYLVAALRFSSSSRACLSERGVMRLDADFLGLAGVLRGRYVSLDKSEVARDNRRMARWRSRDRYSEVMESSEPCPLRSREPERLRGDLDDSDAVEELCSS